MPTKLMARAAPVSAVTVPKTHCVDMNMSTKALQHKYKHRHSRTEIFFIWLMAKNRKTENDFLDQPTGNVNYRLGI